MPHAPQPTAETPLAPTDLPAVVTDAQTCASVTLAVDGASCATPQVALCGVPLGPWEADGLRLHVLGTGSKGNSCVLETPEACILIDCGLSCRQIFTRMQTLGLDPARIGAIIVTHEHTDHIGGLRVTASKARVPVYASRGTAGSEPWPRGVLAEELQARRSLTVCGVRVTPFDVPHDATEPMGFRFERAGDAVGYCTDMGHLTDEAGEYLRDARILALESNHDPAMLSAYPGYPYALKQRIGGDSGHLSNDQAADALGELVTSATQTLVGMHISQHTNLPSICRRALLTGRRQLAPTQQLRVVVGSQEHPLSFA